jgi:hypothetical protein
MAGIRGRPTPSGSILGGWPGPATILGAYYGQGDPASGYYPTRYAVPGQPNMTDRVIGGVLRLPVAAMEGAMNSLDAFGQAMRGDPEAMGYRWREGEGWVGYDPNVMIGHAQNLAGWATTGALGAPGAAGAAGMGMRAFHGPKSVELQGLAVENSQASRSPMLYNPPVKPPRPFEADYPAGADADDAGNLLFDIEGRPLVAERVVGRQVVGGGEVPLPPREYDALAEATIGSRPQTIAARQMPGRGVGAYVERSGPGGLIEKDIYVLDSLSPDTAVKVTAHEIGHMIDRAARQLANDRGIPTEGIVKELRSIYNDLNNPRLGRQREQGLPESAPRAIHPEEFGYSKESVPHELMAEAIRAYMADPNYIKTVAPKTAAAIRKAVNENPTLKKIVQFNTAGLPMVDPAIAHRDSANYVTGGRF